MERGEAVVTHGEVFLQGSPREAPVSRERSWGCAGQWLGPHIHVEAPPSQESWGPVKPCHTQGCWDTPSPKLVGWPSVLALPPHPSFPGEALAGHLSPAVGFGVLWGATELACGSPTQSLCKQIPALENTSHWVIWKRAHVGTAGVGGISLGKCFPLSITSPGCCLLRKTRNWQAVGGMPGFEPCCGSQAPGRAGRSVALSGTEGFPTPGTGTGTSGSI